MQDASAAAAALVVVVALAGGFAVLKIGLARRLAHGGDRTRKAAVAVEIAMTCLGALLTAAGSPSGGVPADFVLLAAFGGAGLSLVAALGLLGRRARHYFATSHTALRAAADSRRDNSASFGLVAVTPAGALGRGVRRVIAGYVSAAGAVLRSWLSMVSGMIAGCDRCAAGGAARGPA